ncbi:hypothetical protein E2R34_05640 [Rathayibacter toxicus]|nr:class I tRNA ligase family protein [Rathayibacter toxicus]QWL30279.1 hypothetical protein E2R34_05640 [Rathayibacter toxicus]
MREDWSSAGVTPDVIGDNSTPAYHDFLRKGLSVVEARTHIRTQQFGWCHRCQQSLVESLAQGTCRYCLHDAYLNVCENCSLPQLGKSIEPKCTTCRQPASRSRVGKVILWSARDISSVAEHMRELHHDSRRADQLFGKLAPHQILWSYPGDYGFRLNDGQLLNPWIEIFFQHLYCVLQQAGVDIRLPWHEQMTRLNKHNPRITYFFGVDNTYYYAFLFTRLAHLVGATAMTPDYLKINEFMTLSGRKMSTSRGNVIAASDFTRTEVLLRNRRRRLAASSPEYAPKEFSSSIQIYQEESKALDANETVGRLPAASPPSYNADRERYAIKSQLEQLSAVQWFSVQDLLAVLAKGVERADQMQKEHPFGARTLRDYISEINAELLL